MLSDAFRKGLRDQLRPFAMWAAGVAFYAFVKLTLLGLSVGSVSFAVGGATGRRQAAVAAGAGVGVLMYLLNTLAVLNETIRPLCYASLFHWAGGASPLGKPLDWGGVLVMVVVALLLLAATLVLFERCDLRS